MQYYLSQIASRGTSDSDQDSSMALGARVKLTAIRTSAVCIIKKLSVKQNAFESLAMPLIGTEIEGKGI